MSQPASPVPALRPRAARPAPRRAAKARAGGMDGWGRRRLLLLALAGAIALPAFAASADWQDRFEIGAAGEERLVMEPMPFETAGSSFPGSAFYYLDYDEDVPGLGQGIHSDADEDALQHRLDTGPAARSMVIDNSGLDRTRALECLTAAVYYEAASEPDSGQRAVAQVVLNRVAHPAYPKTVCGVVYQGSQRKTGCQFSFTCDGSLARVPNRMFWLRAQEVARAALAGYVHRPAGLATHYHTVQVTPYWAPSLHYLGTIGAHRFYSFGGKAGSPATFRFAYAGGEPTAAGLRSSALATEAGSALDPVAVQRAYDEGLARARADAASTTASPAPRYASDVQERGGDALYRAGKLPQATGIRPEYSNSGRWIAHPGA